jgi:hypothetical protein
MIDPRHEELLHRRLDGETTPAEEAELETLLAASPELRVRREELERLFGVLASTPEAVPTEGFGERILQGMRALPVHTRRGSWSEALVRFLRPGWRPAAFFAAGALAGVALMAAFAPRLALEDGAAGTLLSEGRTARGRVLDRQVIELPGGSATFRLQSAAAGAVWVEMDMRTRDSVNVELTFDPASLAPSGVRIAPVGARVQFDAQRVRIENATWGEYRMEFSTRPVGAAAVSVRLEAGGTEIERRLQARPPGGSPSS